MGIFSKIMRSRERMSRMFAQTGAAEKFALCDEAVVLAAQGRCLSCEEPVACEQFLETGGRHRSPPSYCRNREMIERLTAGTKRSPQPA
jgi:hypothetical protein